MITASGYWPLSGERKGSYILLRLLRMKNGNGDDGDNEEKERREEKRKGKAKRDFCEVQISKHAGRRGRNDIVATKK